ncbi:HsdM family class I SAM-dependent methyltransferase [Sphingopyxis terrae]|uniref:site-specific DNA-methyltransferase (adenine-specific) n=1 Tax=Sphingopyxis terrae subsp. ummariensis TaxID=429001 RepID=A0A1Y6FTK5_9SPHN|nr:Eco57I restriction-modification methylase domain-containing protein [Sphingopyxis terrae]PCF91301.1 SAM-dependent methyltransferase [Sphingopyxis terrae subsp. ummariensis]SMQ76470.1 adenine-specific DNA-methyltransferase [Sphingopyxis terrae subsp. ummariensis]
MSRRNASAPSSGFAAEASIIQLRSRCGALRHMARAWAETLVESERGEAVAAFTLEAMSVYETSLWSGTPVPCDLDQPEAELARSAGIAATGLPCLEALHWLTSLYSGLLEPGVRGRLGAYYTPPALAARLLDQAEEAGVDWRVAKVLDPAAGGAAFLADAALRIRAALTHCAPSMVLAQIGTRVRGIELDPHAARIGQRAIEIALGDLANDAGRPVPQVVVAGDSLALSPRAAYDLVIGNPPYGRVTLAAADRERFARGLYGHANLYGLFTDIALRWAKPKGVVAFLTPTSMLSGQYFSALRGLLARDAPPVSIDFVHARRGVFEDVQQETMLAVYGKGSKPQRAQIHYIHVDSASETRIVRNGTIGLPDCPEDPWLAPRQAADGALIARAETMAGRLADLGYRVATGPLVWNRFKPQLRDKPGKEHVHPLIWSEAVCTDGAFRFRAEKKNHSLFFQLEPGDEFLLVQEAAVLVQRTTAKEQRRRIIAAELPADFVETHGGVVVENHLNMLVPVGKPLVSPATLTALLNSAAIDQLFRCISGSVAVSAFELEALPLPSASELSGLAMLVRMGADREALDRACACLYGIGA